MSVAEDLWGRNQDLARACLAHPFVRGLREGSLPAARYAGFIAQDAFFLDAFARCYASGVARAPDRESMRAFHTLQCGVFEEQRLHQSVAAGLEIDLVAVQPLPATEAYANFVLATAALDPLGELLAALTPCMRLYGWLGTQLAQEAGAGRYQSWIDTYAAAAYHDLVATVEALLERHASGNGREARKYRTALTLERRFFDMAWEEEETT